MDNSYLNNTKAMTVSEHREQTLDIKKVIYICPECGKKSDITYRFKKYYGECPFFEKK